MEVVVIGGKHLFAVHDQLAAIGDTFVTYLSRENPDCADILGMWNEDMVDKDLSEADVNVRVTDFNTTDQTPHSVLRQ